MITERCGCASACSSVSLPRATSSPTSEWSREPGQLAAAPQVGARVADVGDRDLGVADVGRAGGAHAGGLLVGARAVGMRRLASVTRPSAGEPSPMPSSKDSTAISEANVAWALPMPSASDEQGDRTK